MTNKRCPTDSAKSVLPVVEQYLLRMLSYTLLALLKTLLDRVSPLEQKSTTKDQQALAGKLTPAYLPSLSSGQFNHRR
ncbi:hypothetical protein [Motilimonas sp. KMU-193]|uniref:hypothetical protein n=1 Tax=Motilimonas sp. KMU-193 TaxID=3388668 RepID=UPI00396AFC4B